MVAVPDLSPKTIDDAGVLLRAGQLVAFPTETVYGLGADARNGRAVAAIFAAKGRPRFNPLIVHVPDLAAAERLAVFSTPARVLAKAFWPGPLTLVLQRRADSGLSDLVTAGLDTVAIRVPGHPIARALLVAAGVPVAAPSANRSGHVSATTAAHVAADFTDVVSDQRSDSSITILDGGPTAHGLESTVLDCSVSDILSDTVAPSGPQVIQGAATASVSDHSSDTTNPVVMLRPGAVPAEAIEAVLGAKLLRALDNGIRPTSPGQLAGHYAPRARVRLEATDVQPNEALLAFGADVPLTTGPMLNISPSADLIEAAANLFAALRRLDATGATAIAVMAIPSEGLGEAINDRLRRAAAGR